MHSLNSIQLFTGSSNLTNGKVMFDLKFFLLNYIHFHISVVSVAYFIK